MKPLTPKQLSSRLNSQLQAVAQGVDQAIDWIETTRQNAPRLDIEADRLIVKLRRNRNKAKHLSNVALKEIAIGFFGLSQAGKSYLISALAAGENGKLETALEGQQFDFLTHINPADQSTTLVTRFSRQAGVKNKSFPVQLLLFSEVDIGKIMANAFLHELNQEFEELDEQHIAEHLKMLLMHRQPEPVAGMSSDEVVALWDYLARHDAKRQKQLETHFWPVAVELAPYLSVDDRAQLFSVLWGDRTDLTAAYRHFSHTLQHLSGAHKVLAPIRVLVDEALRPVNGIINGAALERLNTVNDVSVSVRPVLNGRAGKAVELSQAELTMLAAELLIPLHSPTREALFEQVDILDFPGFGDTPELADQQQTEQQGKIDIHPLAHTLLRAKRAYLLERYTDNQEMNLLMVCTAAGKRSDVKAVGKALDYWVKQTQGENAQVRSRRKPGLIWAVTKFDRRITHGQNHDAAVQRYVGNPGDAWGTMLAMDKRGVSRMAAWLGTEVHREVKLGRISEQLSEIQRELGDNLLGNWYQPAGTDDPAKKQRIAETLLKSLQTRTGVHGELLERLLPSRDELRRLYLKQQVKPGYGNYHQDADELGAPLTGSETFGIGIEIDLFADEPIELDQPTSPVQALDHGYEAEYAHNVYRYWINHLRSLPENAPLVDLLGVAKATIETLVEELITASIRLNIEDALVGMLVDTEQLGVHRESKADRQVSRVLTVLGDFVAWLGFQQRDEALRPASRINRGHKIFAKPEKQAVNWGASQRLTKLALTPTNNTAFYIYDWLVGLNEMIVQNAGYSAGREVSTAQREQLAVILNLIKPAEK
ncbi:virulence factor [Brenneria alni]|uniref:Virulence factor n=1 Tax=Brenneria alni TaxID=71656 RepID=A0A421DN06_9GAMM|nr:virulence factor SrfC family protein [Brenneria alni]RLM22863.1 virulence factor [Brenneria alni]